MKKQVSFAEEDRLPNPPHKGGSTHLELPAEWFRRETWAFGVDTGRFDFDPPSKRSHSFSTSFTVDLLRRTKDFSCRVTRKFTLKDFKPSEKDPFESASGRGIIDPRSPTYQQWTRLFMVSCLVAIFLDPLFFFVPTVKLDRLCFDLDHDLAIAVTLLRTLIDLVYLIHMVVQFRTGFVAPSSRVFGRGELVTDRGEISRRYMKVNFWLDLVAILPLPQVVMWVFLRTGTVADAKSAVLCLVGLHYLPRLLRMLYIVKDSEMVRSENTGMLMERVWVGAALNLVLYLLASHILGACWYLLTVERQESCWRSFCAAEAGCHASHYFSCRRQREGPRGRWPNASAIALKCVADAQDPTTTPFNFGLYSLAVQNNVTQGENFVGKYFYCLWFGLNSLSSLGQGFKVSTYLWEVCFAIVIFVLGLLLFALLIGNVQKYLSSVGIRVDEMRVKRRDAEQWMNHRQLPMDLRNRVRKYDQFKWVETQGVDEQALLQSLPHDLRRDIKRHLCLNLVRRVPLFDQMDDRLLDAICERLQPALHTETSCLVQEGDPVVEMVFIIRGNLESATTNGGRTGFLNLNRLEPGDFCGEELLPWALDPAPDKTLPSSTRTVKATSEVEAFALSARDIKFVASQFRRLHSKKLQHTFRYYSHQWRTWAATFIQATWRRYVRQKMAAEWLRQQELMAEYDESFLHSQSSLRHSARIVVSSSNLSKPLEPDFSRDEED